MATVNAVQGRKPKSQAGDCTAASRFDETGLAILRAPNRAGRISPTTAAAAFEEMNWRVKTI
ncbi:MAG TPA: hypothetical protein VIY29_09485, partial [Ktedonobacteraceae bacterium]